MTMHNKDYDGFDDHGYICAYTRAQALEDGILIDASIDGLGKISRQYYNYPIAMNDNVYNLIEYAVNNHTLNNWQNIWNHIMRSSRVFYKKIDESTVVFPITISTESNIRHWLKLQVHSGDQGEPVITVMLRNDD